MTDITFNGIHLALVLAAFAVGMISGAVYGWCLRDEQKGGGR